MKTNTTTKHTPGPWAVTGLTVYTLAGNPIATAIEHDGANAGVEHANARLIAAAPELLDALQLLTREVSKGFMLNNVACSIDNARAAIAKATE